jgi:uncharacterized protein
MLRESLVSDKPPLTSLLLIFCVVFIGFIIVGPMIGMAVAMAFYSGDLATEIMTASPGPDSFLPFMIIQGFTSLIGLILFPALYIRYVEYKTLTPFFRKEDNFTLIALLVCLLGFVFMIALSPVLEWNMNFEFPEALKTFGDWARNKEDMLAGMTKFLTTFESFGAFLIGLLVIAVLPAIGEEFVFRGLIQNELWRSSRNIHVAIWVSAFLFSAIHLQFFGFFPRMLLGALFGYLYYWSGNLFVPMIGHFFNNGFSLTLIYLQGLGVIKGDLDNPSAAPVSAVAGCAVAVFALLYFFKKHYSRTPETL